MANDRSRARREHLARMRAEQRRRERRAAFLMWGAGGFVIVLLIGMVAFYLIRERSVASLDAVRTYNYEGAIHQTTKITYKETPPVGGPHNPVWQNCGVYDKPINNETAVHSLEHGAVWITYRPDLPASEVEKLKKHVTGDYILLSPYPGLPAPVVVSSWNNQLHLTGADDPRLPRYIAKYKQNATYTPELGAACQGGTDATADEAPLPTPTGDPHAEAEQNASPSPEASATPSASPSESGEE
ncbi:hypothetical protein GCM10010106_09310 [Thermopolyspora flexuosa]|uniref:Uncharacterized protein DUF3105 n=1 Tax=Thermopolyspora flexuosa TaxID=103836 RepID=A0A543J046_9ACTN|nr:DUF3105 domain-containing protein [Thermopolyspora flexuosa]TQM76195.1 uncharacterized protein DUF3105 [Thermopolyspora flexuosa]GGM65444.1 hypothetical protein GCM10010106_09310 [Thermopolyspora flexuosa]